MPFDRTSTVQGGTIGVSKYDKPEPSFLDTLGAAYRQENLIGSALTSARADLSWEDFNRVDPTYNAFDDLAGYEDYTDRFEESYNAKTTQAIKTAIDRERKDRDTLAASGWTGVGLSMVAGMSDPTILIPGGALARAGQVGYRVGRSALAVGAGAAVGTAVQEAGLQATQELRTGTESALAIGGSAILGGIIGGGASAFFSKGEWDRFSKALEEDLTSDIPNGRELTDTIVQRMQSVGAASVDDLKLDDLGIGGPRAAQAIAKATAAARINPGLQTLMSPSKQVRQIYGQMVDNPVYTAMQMEGKSIGPDVENLVKQYQRGALANWIKSSRNHFKEAKKAGYQGTKTEFYNAVSRAGRRGDVDPDGNQFVTRAAQDARAKIFDPLLERAIANKMLPEDVKTTTAASYVTRYWNRQKLIGEENKFREIARSYFRGEIGKIPEGERPDFVSKADLDDYIEEVVTSVFNNLTGRGKGDVPDWLVPLARGPLKERTFRIGDDLVEEFLENDMELILRRYTRTMAAEVELTEKFGRADMKDQFDAIQKEYDELASKATTDKERDKLNRLRQRDISNLEAFRDMIRGTYRAAEESSDWSKLTRGALTWNYIRLLGGVTLTSMADTARFLGTHGLRATMKEALPALVSGVKAAKISRQDARDLGAVTEVILQSRLASLADLQDPYRYGSSYDRFLSNASNVFSKATGLGYWNDMMKMAASVMTQNRMMRNAINYGQIGEREKAYMAFLGINEDMAQRIAKQFDTHGIQEQGIYGANVGSWDDELAARTWAAALNKDVDRTIITKGVADTPLWMKTNWGRLIMQFKSFGLASHQRILIAGLQERPHRLAEQMVMGASIGMLISYLKFVERGDMDRAQELVDNPGLWVADGLDRSGVLSIPFDVSNTADKISASYGGPNVGITAAASALAGDESGSGGVSRYASRNATGAVFGPSVGLFEDLANIASAVIKGEANRGQVNAAIRQIPGASLPGIRTAIHVGVKPALQDAVE